MLPPIGILAFYSYYQTGTFNVVENDITYKNLLIYYALIMAIFFIMGGWIGAKLSFKTPIHLVKLVFGAFMFYASVKLIMSGIQHYLK